MSQFLNSNCAFQVVARTFVVIAVLGMSLMGAQSSLEAQGTPSYTVTFDLGSEGSLIAGDLVQSVPEGGTAIVPEFSVADGWAFVGWDKSFRNVTEDITVLASYIPDILLGTAGEKQMGSAVDAFDKFGFSVSVSGDTALVGTPFDGNGSVYVFVREAGIWVEQARLMASDGLNSDQFGYSVSLEGDTALIGALYADSTEVDSGSAYVFSRSGDTWMEQAKLVASDVVSNDLLGHSVSYSDDTAVIGAPAHDDGGTNAGSVYVFTRSAGVWGQQAKLSASDLAAYDQFGYSVSFRQDTLLVGSLGDDDNGTNSGSAYVFERVGESWVEQTKLLADDGERYDSFGISVSLSGDRGLIGAYQDDDNGINSGSAYVFVKSEGFWTQSAKLISSDGASYDSFGSSVALSGDVAVIGAHLSDVNGANSGSAHVFRLSGGTWNERSKLEGEPFSAYDNLGGSVTLSGDVALVGVIGDDDQGNRSGSAYFFNLNVPPVTVTFDLGLYGSHVGGGALSQQVVVNNAAIAPKVEPLPDWFFLGWDLVFSDVTSDLMVTAIYAPSRTVTFDLGTQGSLFYGELIQDIPAGGTAVVPQFAVADGWAFAGWDNSFSNVSADVVVTAQYIPEGLLGVLESKEVADEPNGFDRFGYDVALSGDTALIGNRGKGIVYVYVRQGGMWIEQAQLSPGRSLSDFGHSVSLCGDTALIGAPSDPLHSNGAGSVFVFVRNGDTWTEQANFFPDDVQSGNRFGWTVSLCGERALIGADNDGDNGSNSGSAYVFVRSGSEWTQEAKLLPGDGTSYDLFGHSVSLSGDTALVGAYSNDDNGSNSGSAYVFVFDGDSWSEEAKLLSDDGASSDNFGYSVSLLGDTALVGAYRDNHGKGNEGSAYVFERSGGVWVQQAKLVPEFTENGLYFGCDVSLGAERVLIGAYGFNGAEFEIGSAYLFVRDGDVWNEERMLRAIDGTREDRFGWSVALGAQTALVGAPEDSEGSAYFYDLFVPPGSVTFDLDGKGTRVGGGALSQVIEVGTAAMPPFLDANPGWVHVGWDVDFSRIEGDLNVTALYQAGYSVTFDLGAEGILISGDLQQWVAEGGTALAPEVSASSGWYFTGWNSHFDNVTSDLVVVAEYISAGLVGGVEYSTFPPGEVPQYHRFGLSVSLDGDTGVIGTDDGMAYVYVRSGDAWVHQATLVPPVPSVLGNFGKQVFIHGDTILVGENQGPGVTGAAGAVYVFVREGTAWIEQARLVADDGAEDDWFGGGLSMSGDTILIGAYQDDDNGSASGSAYVFVRSGGVWVQQAKLTAGDAAEFDLFGYSVSIDGDTALIGAHGDDSSGGAYVFVRNDGVWTEQAKLIASDGGSGDEFGSSVSLNGDTALIGARSDNQSSTYDTGSAYVFTRSADIWTEQAKLIASDAYFSDRFGHSVSLSGDVAVIGAYDNDDFGSSSGSAYAFVRDGATWQEYLKLNALDASSSDYFGRQVSVSGGIALIGAEGSDSARFDGGAAYFYNLFVPPVTVTFDLDGKGVRSGGGLLSQEIEVGTSAEPPFVEGVPGWVFVGWDVDFSVVTQDLTVTALYEVARTVTFQIGTEGTLIAGDLVQSVVDGQAALPPVFSVNDGWAFFGWDRDFTEVASDIVVTAQYIPDSLVGPLETLNITPNDVDDYGSFGENVSISGNTALISASGKNSVYVFVKDGNSWVEQAVLQPESLETERAFGSSVSLDRDTAVVGDYRDSLGGQDAGAAYVFVRSGGVWSQQTVLRPDEVTFYDRFARSVAVSGDTVLIGAAGDDDNGSDSGSAYIFVRSGSLWVQQEKLTASDGESSDDFGWSVSLSGDIALIGAPNGDGNTSNSGSAYVFTRSGEVWSEQAKLIAADGTYSDSFGYSVSLSGDTALVGAHEDDDNGSESGSGYVFVRNAGVWTEEAKLTASDGAYSDNLGANVSLHGDIALLGATGDNADTGSAYIFIRNGETWEEYSKLTSSDGAADDHFGFGVAVTQGMALIGAHRNDGNGNNSGSAYFFELFNASVNVNFDLGAHGVHVGGGELSQQVMPSGSPVAPLVEGQAGWIFLGWDVDFSVVTEDLLVTALYSTAHTVTFDLGAHGTLLNGDLVQAIREGGSAIVPEFTVANGWSFIGWNNGYSDISSDVVAVAQYLPNTLVGTLELPFELPAQTGHADQFGTQVVVEGDTALITDLGNHKVHVYFNDGTQWSEQAVLSVGSGSSSSYLRGGLALSGDTALIGAPLDDDLGPDSGSVYVFVRNAGVWTQQAKINASDGASDDEFGHSVSLSGNTALIGAPQDSDQGSRSGSAYVFVRNGNSWREQAKLAALDGAGNALFGSSVSVKAHTALVGAPGGNNDQGIDSGAAYVFVRSGSNWSQQAKLNASDSSGDDEFGASVALSGETALIGAPDGFGNVDSSGTAYVFVRDGNLWSEQAKLMTDDGKRLDYFGKSVSLDGNIAVIGAQRDGHHETEAGSVYIYTRVGNAWMISERVNPFDGDSGDYFGNSVSISGNALLVGANFSDRIALNSGNAYFFNLSTPPATVTFDLDGKGTRIGGGALIQSVEVNHPAFPPIVQPDSGWAMTGWGVDINRITGDTLATAVYVPGVQVTFDLGAHGSLITGDLVQWIPIGDTAIEPVIEVADGWAFIGWDESYSDVSADVVVTAQYISDYLIGALEEKHNAPDGELGDKLGYSVSISGDVALVGAPEDDDNGTDSGSAYVYIRDESGWVIQTKLTPSDGAAGDLFGTSVSVDGDTALIGSYKDDDSITDSGSAYIFVRNNGVWTEQAKLKARRAHREAWFGFSVSLSGDTALIGAYNNELDNVESGSAHVFVRENGIWYEQALLWNSEGNWDDQFGYSVSLEGDFALVGAYGDDDFGTDSGSAFVFVRNGGTWTQEAQLNASNASAGDWFGRSVSIQGSRALIGAPRHDEIGTDAGSVFLFQSNSGSWAQSVQLNASDGQAYEWFGNAVSISGGTIVVGQERDSGNFYDSGAAYVFQHEGIFWNERIKLTALEDGSYHYFGASVAVYNSTAVVGTPRNDELAYDSGSVHFFDLSVPPVTVTFDLDGQGSRTGGGELIQLVQVGTVPVPPRVDSIPGVELARWDVAFDYVTTDMVVTAIFEPAYQVVFELGAQGALVAGELNQSVVQGSSALMPEFSVADGWVFEGWDSGYSDVQSDIVVTAQYFPESLNGLMEVKGTVSDGDVGDELGRSVSISGDTAIAGAPEDEGGSARIFVRNGASWIEQAILRGSETGISGSFGYSVSIHGDTALVGDYRDDNENGVAAGCVYVFVRNNGVWTEQAKLVASDGSKGDYFGYSVSVHGDFALIGAYRDDDAGTSSGSAYVFVRSGGVWTEQTKLTSSQPLANALFGISLELDGDTALIGASSENSNGAAYVFVQNAGVWTEEARLIASDGAFADHFGRSVSISGDVAVIGAYRDDYQSDSTGSAYIFERSGGIWQQGAKLFAADRDYDDNFGWSVSIAGDRVLIGAYGDYGNSGSIYEFLRRDSGLWIQHAKLTASDREGNDRLGYSVSISGDIGCVGAYLGDDFGSSSGAVYFYDLGPTPLEVTFDLDGRGQRASGGLLSQLVGYGQSVELPLIQPDLGWFFVGWDTALDNVITDLTVNALYKVPYTVTFELGEYGSLNSGDLVQVIPAGGTAKVPDVLVADGWSFNGWDNDFKDVNQDVLVTAQYAPSIVTTIFEQKEIASDGSNSDSLGHGAVVSGNIALVGAPYRDSSESNTGGVFVYVKEAGAWSFETLLIPTGEAYNATFGFSVALSGDTAVIGAPGHSENGPNAGSVHVFVRSDGVWEEQAVLIASDGNWGDWFGRSVAVSGDYILVGAPSNDTGSGRTGSAYVFKRVGNVWCQMAKLLASDRSILDSFGHSVSIDGDAALIGAPYNSVAATGSGSAYLFERDGDNWNEVSRILASDRRTGDNFGRSVSIVGEDIVIGASRSALVGSVYVFTLDEFGITESSKIQPSDGDLWDAFGWSVSLSGNQILIGAHGNENKGSAYLFERNGGVWTEVSKLVASDGEGGDRFGEVVSLSGDTALVAAPDDEAIDYSTGSAYFYDLAITPSQVTVSFDLGENGIHAGGGALSQQVFIGAWAVAPIVDANPGWLFDDWNGDFSAVMENMTVTAQYSVDPDDTDGDRMLNAWEMTYFGSINVSDGTGDFDQDGSSDLEEFVTGNVPTDGSDFFHVISQSFSNNMEEVILTFTSNDELPARSYRILYKEKLTDAVWLDSPLGAFGPDAGDVTTKTFSLPQSNQYFFRVECSLDDR